MSAHSNEETADGGAPTTTDGSDELLADAIAELLEEAGDTSATEVREAVRSLRDGRMPSEAQVRALRASTERLALVTEEYVAASCEATEPESARWGGDDW